MSQFENAVENAEEQVSPSVTQQFQQDYSFNLTSDHSHQSGNKLIICTRILRSLRDLAPECLMDQWLM